MEDKIVYRQKMMQRTKAFALQIIALYGHCSYKDTTGVLGKQILRSATSIAANYRAACRARSGNEFFAKLCITVEEADETLLWLELLSESGLLPADSLEAVMQESLELVKILATARKNAQP